MKSGVSVIELLVGCALLAVVVSVGAYALRPVAQANKKYRLTLKAHRLEDEIRRGIFYQSNYNNNTFQIVVNNVTLAKQGEVMFIKEDFSGAVAQGSSAFNSPDFNTEEYPLVAKVSLDSATDTLVYQVHGADSRVGVATLGVSGDWPPPANYASTNESSDYSILKVPPELSSSLTQNCQKGIMRGIAKGRSSGTYAPICWEYQEQATSPTWAIPTGYTLDNSTNKIEIIFSKLNKPKCPKMEITNLAGRSWAIPNFYAFTEIDLRDLFPTKDTNSTMSATQCEVVIDFFKEDSTGLLPQTVVRDSTKNNKPGFCPDKNLYILNDDGSCSLNFHPNTIPARAPAQVGL